MIVLNLPRYGGDLVQLAAMSSTNRAQSAPALLAVYVDGETKTGKGSASMAIAEALRSQGVHEYYDVAGDFYRRYVAQVRRKLGLGEADDLPTGNLLFKTAQALYDDGKVFEVDMTLGDLQRPSISKSVSALGELPIAQKAGSEWFLASVRQAQAASAEVLVLDGRNPRDRVQEVVGSEDSVRVVLDLYLTCDPTEAARRTLLAVMDIPTAQQLEAERAHIADRRDRDRKRVDRPFLLPEASVVFNPRTMKATAIVQQSWVVQGDARLPVSIVLDNTRITKPEMLAAVTELATEAVVFAKLSPDA